MLTFHLMNFLMSELKAFIFSNMFNDWLSQLVSITTFTLFLIIYSTIFTMSFQRVGSPPISVIDFAPCLIKVFTALYAKSKEKSCLLQLALT